MTGLLAIVPARAGSKGVPGKNKAVVDGMPLIEHTVRAAEAATSVSGIVVTSDDEDILRLYSERSTVFVVQRPAELAADDVPTAPAVAHALDHWRAGGESVPDALILLQPTTPLRNPADIDAAHDLFRTSADSDAGVISACRVDGMRHPRVMYRIGEERRGELFLPDNEDRMTRHQYEELYQRNGAIYIVATEYFYREKRLRSLSPIIYEMPWVRSINVDGPGDLLIARALLESGLLEEGDS